MVTQPEFCKLLKPYGVGTRAANALHIKGCRTVRDVVEFANDLEVFDKWAKERGNNFGYQARYQIESVFVRDETIIAKLESEYEKHAEDVLTYTRWLREARRKMVRVAAEIERLKKA